MKRIVVLTALIAAGAVSYVVAQQGGQKPMVVEVEKLKDNLFVLKAGGGGNTTVFVQSNGITVVDTKNPGWGAPILEKIKELSPKPVTTIINTHTHGDHVSGNVEFPATVDIVVQENTATNMKADEGRSRGSASRARRLRRTSSSRTRARACRSARSRTG